MKSSRVLFPITVLLIGTLLPVMGLAKQAHETPPGIAIIAPDEVEDSVVLDGQRVSLATGIPVALYDPRFSVTPGTPEEMVQEYLRLNADTFQLQSPTLDDLVHHHTRASDVGYTVRYRQTYQGLPVYNADFTVTVNKQNTVIFVMNSYRPDVALADVIPLLSAEQARGIAVGHINPTGDLVYESNELIVYHNQGVSRLVYQVKLVPSVSPTGDWELLVDAKTGEIVKAVDRAHYVNGTGSLFDPDPLSSAQATYGQPGYVDGNDANTPQLLAEIFTYVLPDISFNGVSYSLTGPYAECMDFEGPFYGTFSQANPNWIYTRFDNAFEASLCYWHIDNFMRYMNVTLGTSCMPYQYATGVRFDPHGLNGADNSHYISSSGRLAFGEGGVDDSEDADVVIHELGHGIHDWLTVGGLSQVNGLSEGFGDYCAASYSRSLNQWPSSASHYNWVFSWDGHNPFWPGRVTNWAATYPGGLTGQIHTDGQIFSTCMMRIWDAIGGNRTDKAVFEGLAMTNGSTSQQGAASAIMQAAINMNYTVTELAAIYSNMTQTGYSVQNPVAVGDANDGGPRVALLANLPNPFSPRTTIKYQVPEAGNVRVTVHDASGRLVVQLVDQNMTAGEHSIGWDGRDAAGHDVAAGVYLIQLETAGTTDSRRAVLLR